MRGNVQTPEFLAVGHLCCDIIDGRHILGGSASYASLTARELLRDVGILTAVADDFPFLNLLKGISVYNIGSPATTTFRNIYRNGLREQFVSKIARSILPADIPDKLSRSEIVYLCPIANEVHAEVVSCFSSSLLGVGAQGWFREWDKSGKVRKKAWETAIRVAETVDVIVYSELDTDTPYELAEELAHHAPVVVVTQSSSGAEVFTDGRRVHVPAFEVEEVDPTGAGDVFAASFLIRYKATQDPIESAKFACCAASFVCEKEGTEGIPSLAQVQERLQQYNEAYSNSLR